MIAIRQVLLLALCAAVLVGCAARNVYEASRNGNQAQVRQMLDADPQLANQPQTNQVPGDINNRWTPLHYAADAGHADIVQLLLDRGADPLAPARGGWTPLHAAKAANQGRIVKMLEKAVLDSGRPLP